MIGGSLLWLRSAGIGFSVSSLRFSPSRLYLVSKRSTTRFAEATVRNEDLHVVGVLARSVGDEARISMAGGVLCCDDLVGERVLGGSEVGSSLSVAEGVSVASGLDDGAGVKLAGLSVEVVVGAAEEELVVMLVELCGVVAT